jgi:hypothetical protein
MAAPPEGSAGCGGLAIAPVLGHTSASMGTHPDCAVFCMHGDVAERLKAAVC